MQLNLLVIFHVILSSSLRPLSLPTVLILETTENQTEMMLLRCIVHILKK